MAEISPANPVPRPAEAVPADVAVQGYLPGILALFGPDPALGRRLSAEEAAPQLVARLRQIVAVERERGSRPARRRFLYAERHGHQINVLHPPDRGALTVEQEVAQKLRDRLSDANREIVVLTQRLTTAAAASAARTAALDRAAHRWAKVAGAGWALVFLLTFLAFVR